MQLAVTIFSFMNTHYSSLLISFPGADGLIQKCGFLQAYSLTSTGDWEKGTGFVASVPTRGFGSATSLSGNNILSLPHSLVRSNFALSKFLTSIIKTKPTAINIDGFTRDVARLLRA